MAKVSELLQQVAHRPWPVPRQPWLMTQRWERLLFAHWPVDADVLQPLIPEGLTLDTFQGQAWISVVPFHMSFRMRGSPWALRFGELNIRTYVVAEGKPGVFFFSLDASDRFTVHAARQCYALPYFLADIEIRDGHQKLVQFTCQRRGASDGQPRFIGSYQPTSPVFRSATNTLDYWLTERYCLYSQGRNGSLYRGHVHHLPWELQQTEAAIDTNTIVETHGIELPDTPPILHYAHTLDVVLWALEPVRSR